MKNALTVKLCANLMVGVASFLLWGCGKSKEVTDGDFVFSFGSSSGSVLVSKNGKKVIQMTPFGGTYEVSTFDKDGVLTGHLRVPLDRKEGDGVTAMIKIVDQKKGEYEEHLLSDVENLEGSTDGMVLWGRAIHDSNSTVAPVLPKAP